MKHKEMVSLQQMKEALGRKIGSKFPVKITTVGGEPMIRYIRGFADTNNNILLVAENAHTLALKILEVREICRLEFAHEHSQSEWKTLGAKWLDKRAEDCNCR